MTKKKNTEELSGFKEVLDFAEPKKDKNFSSSNEGYAVYSFLEQEQKRLNTLDELFSNKYINIKRYPQTETLLINEGHKKGTLKDRLFEQLKTADSPFNKHLEQIFNSVFK